MAVGTSRDGGFTPKLVFGTDQAAVVFFETYGTAADSRLPDRSTRGRHRSRGARADHAPSRGSSPHRTTGAWSSARCPIAPLAPGDYTIRAIVSLDGRPVGRVSRTLQKERVGKLTADNFKLPNLQLQTNSRSSGFEIFGVWSWKFGVVTNVTALRTIQRTAGTAAPLRPSSPAPRSAFFGTSRVRRAAPRSRPRRARRSSTAVRRRRARNRR